MNVVVSPSAMAAELDGVRAAGGTVGLVPTMGAIHDGHASLIERAAAECDTVVVSIFVNPLQFGAKDDFDHYPRPVEVDAERASKAGATHVFLPSVTAMYPEGFQTSVHVGQLAESLEGAARPGHFDGVATVVTKLFAVAGRCRAYFGEKDFQQLGVVKRLAVDLGLPVTVVGCPTVREADGLALSSRNIHLSDQERAAAPVLHCALVAGRAARRSGERDLRVVEATMGAVVHREPLVALDYARAVDPETLARPAEDGPVRLLIAGRLGSTRLIDNLSAP